MRLEDVPRLQDHRCSLGIHRICVIHGLFVSDGGFSVTLAFTGLESAFSLITRFTRRFKMSEPWVYVKPSDFVLKATQKLQEAGFTVSQQMQGGKMKVSIAKPVSRGRAARLTVNANTLAERDSK
jgi:hypothetical protein